jgi:hypothetical protein
MRPLFTLLRVLLALLLVFGAIAFLRPSSVGRSGDRPDAVSLPPRVRAVAPHLSLPETRIADLPGGPTIGLADNRPETILDPRFKASGIKRIRVLVPYDDIAHGGIRLRYLDAWFDTAKANGIEPLVSFYRSYRSMDLLPSVATYRRNFRLFRKRYPWVRYFSTWDEANFPDAQPTGNFPSRTAQFYRAARSECSGGLCTVITADFRAEGSTHSAWWLREFKRHIGRGPHIWGLVAHPDVNRRSSGYTTDFLRKTSGPVWVTEVGPVHFFGRGFRPSIPRQTRAMRYLMTEYPRLSTRIRRIYVYHWRAAAGNRLWDSALLSVDGKPRPAYHVFFEALGKPAPQAATPG